MNFRNVICLDLETCLIRCTLQAPPVSVCSIFHPDRGARLFGTFELEAEVAKWLRSDAIIVGHNIAYDMVCLFEWYPGLRILIKTAYEQNRILDTGLLWRIIEISKGDMRGGLALDRLCQLVGLHHESKHSVDEDGDEIRLGFGKHWGTDLSKMSPDEVVYCQDDVVLCWKLFERIWQQGWATQKDLGKLCRTDFCLKTISAFGLRADPEITDRLEVEARAMIAKLTALAVDRGFMRYDKGKEVPTRTLRAYQQAVADAFQVPVRCGEGRNRNRLYPDVPDARMQELVNMGIVTDTGAVSTGRMALQESGDEMLIMLADLNEWLAVVNKDMKIFRKPVFHTRFGFANTLRTTSSKPNIQNFRKKAGVRECIRAIWGAFVASDYVGLENGTLAQCIVNYTGRRGMADKISAGLDLHCEVGRLIHGEGLSYEAFKALVETGDEHAKLCRGAAKPLNFGLPGNMKKALTFMSYARIGYGVTLTLERAQELMQLWWDTQDDQMAYLAHIDREFKDGQHWGALYSVPTPGSDIVRRGCTPNAAANHGFQSLGMQTAADALWLIVMAQLVGNMPGRACAFVHDEVISDCKPEDIDQVAYLQDRYMLQAAEANLPDVVMKVESQAMTRWTKKFPKGYKHHDENGRMKLYQVPRAA